MEKVLISLTDPQIAWLETEAQRLGINRSELVRRIIDEAREKTTQRDAAFWNKVDKSAGPDACWIWTSSIRRGGYGSFNAGAGIAELPTKIAHRVAYILTYGAIPTGLDIMHTCDVPGCVNPAHLRAGTTAENCQDMVKKGRHWTKKPGVSFESVRHARGKLTREQIRVIRNRYAQGDILQKTLANEYGVGKGHISAIINGHHWPE